MEVAAGPAEEVATGPAEQPPEKPDLVITGVEALAQSVSLTDAHFAALAANAQTLISVTLAGCAIGKRLHLLAPLLGAGRLKILKLDRNGIGNEFTTTLLPLLRGVGKTLEELSVCNNYLKDEDMLALAAALPDFPALLLLSITENSIGEEAATHAQSMFALRRRLKIRRDPPFGNSLLELGRYLQARVCTPEARDRLFKTIFAGDEARRCKYYGIYSIHNPRKKTEYTFGREFMLLQQQTRGAKLLPNELILFRAVEPKDFLETAENGIDVRKERGGRYGRGLYFATTPAGALVYFPFGQPMVLFQCKVLVGHARPAQRSDISLFHEPAGFDSIYGPMRTEQGYVVYSNNRVLIEHAAVVVLPAERAPLEIAAVLAPVPAAF
jgi:hypothetical protein